MANDTERHESTTSTVSDRDRSLKLVRSQMDLAIEFGLIRLRVEDQSLTGESITVNGQELINFGSCAYLGLNVDDRLKTGAIDAINQYGPVFSSSTAYTSVDLYSTLEHKLSQIFGGTVLVPTTTTLGHLSVLPVLVKPRDLVLLDHQVHASVQLTGNTLRGLGAQVETVPHNDMDTLRSVLDERSGDYDKVWYLADGIYSMFGDTAPVTEIMDLVDRFENLRAYFDDAHGVGWMGERGKGYVLSQVPLHDRMIVIGSLAKSWGAGGSVLVLPDGDIAEQVLLAGATFTFSGPLHPAELGAAVAAAEIHLSPELVTRQQELMKRIDYVRDRLVAAQLPAMSLERTPIWYVRVGAPANAGVLARQLINDGFYPNVSGFPAVPWGMDGIRFTNTLYHSEEHLERFMDALEKYVPGLVVPLDSTVDLR
ncbi:MAG: aminotransferase class I/II-fold pyridoxal phosphate-dependent enzyme [Actinomycetia bacterium]|nr:aminotransferase class I/II-fold pyridoxal phosphate-dependent enzyme [Actinomycetes bacterium]